MTEQNTALGTEFRTAVIDNGSFGTREITFSTGRLAKQAAGSVIVQLGETVVLSATTAGKQPKEHFDFFPLTVDVEERMYAAGRIPGSFFRREGRPSEDAILTCRLIDRPLRPSFKSRASATRSRSLSRCWRSTRKDLVRRPGDQRRVDVHADRRPALQRPHRRHPRRAHRGPVGQRSRPTSSSSPATFDMVVAGRVVG